MLAGIPHRIGFAADGRILLTRAVAARPGRHQADRYLDLLRADGLPVDDGHNENWIATEAAERVAPVLRQLPAGRPRVFVAMRSTAPEKHWPGDRWAEVIRLLVRNRGCEIILCGSPNDVPEHEKVLRMLEPDVVGHVHDVSRDVRLRDTGALLAYVNVCLGVDTGLIHLAASHGVPAVVLFGPTDPNQWSPWSPRAIVLRSTKLRQPWFRRLWPLTPEPRGWPIGEASLDDIPVGDVLKATRGFLPRPGQAAATLPTLDLRQGSYAYEVATATPATKPLAQAH